MGISEHLRGLGEYNKALVALGTQLVIVLAGITAISGDLNPKIGGWIVGTVGAMNVALVYLTKNANAIDLAGDRAADLYDRMRRR